MAISDDVVANIITAGLTAPVAFWAGRWNAKKNERRAVFLERLSSLISDIRIISDDAQAYFTTDFEPRDRFASTVSLQSGMRRLSSDLSVLMASLNSNDQNYIQLWTNFYNAVTIEPFGDESVDVKNIDQKIIENVQVREEELIRLLRSYE